MIVKQEFIQRGNLARPGILLSNPTSITIHWIGPYPNQVPADVIKWWTRADLQPAQAASAHYIIKDELCVQCIPEGEVAWHCGCKGNYTSIGIEVIPVNKIGEFSADTIATLQQLLKHLPQVELKRHYDWTGKDCPRYYTNVTDLFTDRQPNPPGGDERWTELVKELRNG